MKLKNPISILLFLALPFLSFAQWSEQVIVKNRNTPIRALHPVENQDTWFISADSNDDNKMFYKAHNDASDYSNGLIDYLTASYDATSMRAIDNQVAIIGFSGRSFTAKPSIVLRTENGGTTWDNITPIPASPSVFTSVTHLFDYNNGMIFSDDNTNRRFICYVSSSIGDYWVQVWNGSMVPRVTGESSRTLRDFYNDNVWIYSVNLIKKEWRILHTTDKGYSWKASNFIPESNFYPSDFAFCNNTEGVLIPYDLSSKKPIFRTNDGGMTWSAVKDDKTASRYVKQAVCHVKGTQKTFAAAFIRNDSLFTAFTSDFGRNWYGWEFVQYEKNQLCKDIAFATSLRGWVLGGTDASRVFHWKGDLSAYPEFQESESEPVLQLRGATASKNMQQQQMNIYPNPASDILNINWDENTRVQFISIIDMFGKRLKMLKSFSNEMLSVDISDLMSGQYIVEIKTEEAVLTKKIVVHRF
jgi:photosystem II stability/assembly factor-like uncharacterized protein